MKWRDEAIEALHAQKCSERFSLQNERQNEAVDVLQIQQHSQQVPLHHEEQDEETSRRHSLVFSGIQRCLDTETSKQHDTHSLS